ncbi:hypothetical protein [uncultured Lacinutrix sp.]|uniref:hypothetical protein n=1 Tax=uncultured Lacinutrix sp. TaxID=574032 RepID=UPI002635E099|nr:hypothetical protein [uncultured Lacinutrix sp.]
MKYIRTFLFVLIITIICSYVLFKYYNFKKYVNVYNNQSSVLTERMEHYSINKLENLPNNKKDFSKMLQWLNNEEGIQNILEYGINFRYDNLDQSLSIYSFGIDKIDDNLKKPSYSTSTDKYSIFSANDAINDWSFWDIFDVKKKDVLLFKIVIDEDYLCRNFINSDLYSGKDLSIPYSTSYVFFRGNQKVSGKLEKELKEKIRPYKHFEYLNDSSKISFIRFKDGDFFPACSDNIDSNTFDIKIKDILIDNKIDYAIIPILTNGTDVDGNESE